MVNMRTRAKMDVKEIPKTVGYCKLWSQIHLFALSRAYKGLTNNKYRTNHIIEPSKRSDKRITTMALRWSDKGPNQQQSHGSKKKNRVESHEGHIERLSPGLVGCVVYE
ncbi:unnamed protein product [Cuscuta epithymum]|uniref:Uncharacterized protein n=1 Tax=Cuscuta epithymum TaxID=186058 RepID=A0AAV0F085_9ASTE|nr:unnamed protein product [Cuscuta epithymum]CAH9128936.1 unnamed protein product [Cuscuta epithymum]